MTDENNPDSGKDAKSERPQFVTREDLGADTIEVANKSQPQIPDTEPRPTASGWTAPTQTGPPPAEVYPQTPAVATMPAQPPVGAGPYDPQVGEYFDKRDFGRLPRRSGPFRRIAVISVVLVLVGFVGYSAFNRWHENQTTWTQAVGEEVVFTIEDGWTLNQVADGLESADVVKSGFWFRRWCNDRVDETVPVVEGLSQPELCDFQAGDYTINKYLSFELATAVLREGPEAEVFFKVNIPEGLTIDEIGPRLVAQNPEYSLIDINEAFDKGFVDSLLFPEDKVLFGVPGFRHRLEGLLFPATYDIGSDEASDEIALLTKMAAEMEGRFSIAARDGLPQVAQDLDLDDYDMLIIASMIEEEAKIDGDRPKIARVIYNRLLAGDTLGIDASTRYAVNKRPGDPLLQSDLESESPYNTRAVTGLPPTPIAAPGDASLQAALNPEEGEWYYYVLTNEGGVAGAHTFAVTNAEFLAAKDICIELDLGCG